jgi:hypothetical protein
MAGLPSGSPKAGAEVATPPDVLLGHPSHAPATYLPGWQTAAPHLIPLRTNTKFRRAESHYGLQTKTPARAIRNGTGELSIRTIPRVVAASARLMLGAHNATPDEVPRPVGAELQAARRVISSSLLEMTQSCSLTELQRLLSSSSSSCKGSHSP